MNVDDALALLPLVEPTEDDIHHIRARLQSLFDAGWSFDDAVAFHRLTEECGCPLPEDDALRQMAVLRAKYHETPHRNRF